MASVIGAGPWFFPGLHVSAGRPPRDQAPAAHHEVPRGYSAESFLSTLPSKASGTVVPSTITDREIAAFAPLAVNLDAHDLLVEVNSYLQRGFSAERVFIELLAPAARHLGTEWTADRLDFLDVTMALWRLQEVLREVAARTGGNAPFQSTRRVLFSPLPGDQHSFGAAMIDECFSRAGWDSELLVEPTRPMLLERLADGHFDLVGLTVTNDCHIGDLTSLIVAIRTVSRNSHLRIMLGGRVLIEHPEYALRAGADGTAATATDALDLAERLVKASLDAVLA